MNFLLRVFIIFILSYFFGIDNHWWLIVIYPIIVGLVESLDLVARRDREGRMPRDLQGTWDWTV